MNKKVKYSRKPKIKFSDLFKKNKTLSEQLSIKETNKPLSGWPLILGYLGIFLIIIGIIDILPIGVMFFYPDELSRFPAFLIPGVISIIIGVLLSNQLKNKDKARLGQHQDLVLLIAIWLVCCLVGSVPFMLPDEVSFLPFRIGGLGLSFIQALFETTSGFTTTGLTILTDSITPTSLLMGDGHCFLFFRSLIMLFGGVGFVLVLTCVISDTYGMRLYYSEGHTDRLLPNLYKSAKTILSLYLGLVIVGSIALWLGGMNEWTVIKTPVGCEGEPTTASYFEALCISMTTISTGGFATRNLSIYAYNNLTIEIITEILMLLGGTNFLILFSTFTFKFKKVFKDLDVKVEIIFALIFIPLLVLLSTFTPTMIGRRLDFSENIRYTVFYFISSLTTTGASNFTDVKAVFSLPGYFIIVLIMSCGCQQGSTCSGIKLYRIGLAIKSISWTIKEKYNSLTVVTPHYISKNGEEKEIHAKEIFDNLTYILLYLILLVLASVLVAIGTKGTRTIVDCLFEVSSALSSAGLTSGIVNFNQSGFVLFVLSFVMFIGRLEIYAFIYGAYRIILDIKSLFSRNEIKKNA